MHRFFLNSKPLKLYLVTLLMGSLVACSTNQIISKRLGKEFKNSSITKHYQVGFALYDMQKKEMIFEKDGDKYFTPASNTKLFTYYAGLKLMPDSIPGLRYVENADSLFFWGTGDPSFLHTTLKGTKAFEFLKSTSKKLVFSPGRYTGNFYGNGWQWDDYNDYYQVEINELPIMDNVVSVTSTAVGKMKILPQTFATCFVKDSLNKKAFSIVRDFNANTFHYPNTEIPARYSQQIPYKVSVLNTVNLLMDTLKKPIEISHRPMPVTAKTVYNIKSDSAFKHMLIPSDNFLAEQLLVVYGDKLGVELNSTKVIDYVTKNYLSTLPDPPRWVDGSGLSRGNLFTPRDMVALLQLIYAEVGDQNKLFDMLPAGGKTGTLKNAYPKTNAPYVFGKTGTLTANHNQSGYVVTKRGKVFIFSFMNNNFVSPTAEVRKEMGRIITYIHDNF